MFDHGKVRYFLEPHSGALLLGNTSPPGQQYMVSVNVTEEGSWIQLRTHNFASCPAGHPHFVPVLTVLAALNYHYRSIKYTLDPTDGEIAAFADLLVADTEPTVDQVFGLIGFFMRLLDEGCPRLMATIQTGKDPGPPAIPEQPEELI
jgi:hypothetical protein